jgi:hypothetical protein
MEYGIWSMEYGVWSMENADHAVVFACGSVGAISICIHRYLSNANRSSMIDI